jgi:hypothetical protein
MVPAYGRMITASTFNATHALMPRLNASGIGCGIGTISHPDIGEVRNMMLSMWFYEMPQHSHMLFVDADMGFPPELVLDMLAFNEPCVGAMYRKKGFEVEWAASGIEGTPEARGGYMELAGLGMGCFLIRRDAVQAMIDHFPDLVQPTDDYELRGLLTPCPPMLLRFFDGIDRGSKGRVSEDISFCMRYRETGGKVWGAGHYEITHEGPAPFIGSYNRWCMETGK